MDLDWRYRSQPVEVVDLSKGRKTKQIEHYVVDIAVRVGIEWDQVTSKHALSRGEMCTENIHNQLLEDGCQINNSKTMRRNTNIHFTRPTDSADVRQTMTIETACKEGP